MYGFYRRGNILASRRYRSERVTVSEMLQRAWERFSEIWCFDRRIFSCGQVNRWLTVMSSESHRKHEGGNMKLFRR